MLGLDALNFANEGKLVIAVERNAAEQVLAALHSHPLGKDAALIGEVVERKGVRLAGLYGVKQNPRFTTRRTASAYMLIKF
ncbi:AIR synthase-related protein [Escherichia coli]|nr:AIR synthase-related protein [Escherichia coli]